jgi:hypothetical protein
MGPGANVKSSGLVVAIGAIRPGRRKGDIQALRGGLLYEGSRYCLNSELPDAVDPGSTGTLLARGFPFMGYVRFRPECGLHG